MEKTAVQTVETGTTRTNSKARREKGIRADPLADCLFYRGGRAFVAGLRHVFIRRSALFPSVLWITPKNFLIFLKNI